MLHLLHLLSAVILDFPVHNCPCKLRACYTYVVYIGRWVFHVSHYAEAHIKDDFEFIARQHDVERVVVVCMQQLCFSSILLLSYSSPSAELRAYSLLTQIVLLLLSSLSIAELLLLLLLLFKTSKRALQLTACTIQMMGYSITFLANAYKLGMHRFWLRSLAQVLKKNWVFRLILS